MNNPGEDSLHAHNSSSNNSTPTSEVGSSPFVTLDQLIAIMNQSRGQRVSVEPKEVLPEFNPKTQAPTSRSPAAGPEVKLRKLFDPRIKCHYCGVPGHKIAECRTRMKTERQETTRRLEKSRPAVSSKVSCFKCCEEGHIAPNCPLLRKTNRDSDNEPRVNSCVVESPTGKLSHLGESFSFCFYSGAECSLIRESIVSMFYR
jgi:hypothetical protein